MENIIELVSILFILVYLAILGYYYFLITKRKKIIIEMYRTYTESQLISNKTSQQFVTIKDLFLFLFRPLPNFYTNQNFYNKEKVYKELKKLNQTKRILSFSIFVFASIFIILHSLY